MVPRAKSDAQVEQRAVSGVPLCHVMLVDIDQSPTTCESQPPWLSQCRFTPHGSCQEILPVTACRRSKLESAHSASRFWSSCATVAPPPVAVVLSRAFDSVYVIVPARPRVWRFCRRNVTPLACD